MSLIKYEPVDVKPGYDIFLNHTVSSFAKSAFLYIQHVGEQYFDKNELNCDRQDFKSIHILITLDGKGSLTQKDKNYTVHKGQVMIINCLEHHLMSSDPVMGWHYKWIHFSGFNSELFFNMIYEKFGNVINFNEDSFIASQIDSLIEIVLNIDINAEIKASNILTQILTHVYLNGNTQTENYHTIHSRMKAVLLYIDENLASDLNYDDLVKIACYSKYHLPRIFKAFTGYSPHEYIIKLRINKAKNLLKSTDRSVDEISGIVGFQSPSNFINTFRKLEGITPLKFKKLQVYGQW